VPPKPPSLAQLVRDRLLADQAARPIAEQRTALGIVANHFERAGWIALVRLLSVRVRTEPQLMPMLQALLRRRPGE
jgi:hypothetical protein